uniref:C2H2-type domain-containing protein n=1 Tax=Hyaloperonospora arabidopsidis (strain Emoy2) TaxID=559515 RepID=M4C3D1_HYAAE
MDGNGCGTVVQDHIVHEGSAYRKFEGEEDKSHHGPAPNKLFSTGHNLRTLISQMKQKACRLIDHTMSNLDLHEIVSSRAKKMFAEFRDVREHVHQFDAMVAGCVIAAYMETSKEMYSAQNGIRIGQHKQAGIATLALLPNKAVDEKKLHPFTCSLCDMKFNARRGMQFHKCAGKAEEDQAKTSNGADLRPVVMPELLQPIIEMKNGKRWFKCP